ncbi:CoA-transferase family III domain-containing protein [Mycena floridula]|nr:CoA-transferase family III domain-containing protein [Mycena floridula]
MALAGLKVVEFAGLAPGPFAGLILADNGAEVMRIDRPASSSNDLLCRGKRSIAIDCKLPSGRLLAEKLISQADILIDPFRPGVLERLGLGPELFLGDGVKDGLNPRLIYARIVGFPRTGPHKDMAGHDINYLAISGVLSMLPGEGKPKFPMNILADFAGGGMTLVMGILLALTERNKTGRGQTVNTDMVSGTRYLSIFPLIRSSLETPQQSDPRGKGLLDGGTPFYDVHCCKGGGWMSVGCLEPQFYQTFLEIFFKALPADFQVHNGWKPSPERQYVLEERQKLRDFIEMGFMTNSREYWTKVFDGTDACVLPVLTSKEAARLQPSGSEVPATHPQITSTTKISDLSALVPSTIPPGRDTIQILKEIGMKDEDLKRLAADGAIESLKPRM